MPIQATRSTLLARLRDGPDRDSGWREFDATYRDLIRRYCLRSGLQTADSEDVQQIVMTNLSKALPNFRYSRAIGRFRDYLGRTVKNAIIQHRTRSQRTPVPTDPARTHEAEHSETWTDAVWDAEWINHHLRRALQSARSSFDPKSLQIFERLLAGDSARQLAASFGISEAGVYKVKHRVRDHLKTLVAQQVREEEFEEHRK